MIDIDVIIQNIEAKIKALEQLHFDDKPKNFLYTPIKAVTITSSTDFKQLECQKFVRSKEIKDETCSGMSSKFSRSYAEFLKTLNEDMKKFKEHQKKNEDCDDFFGKNAKIFNQIEMLSKSNRENEEGTKVVKNPQGSQIRKFKAPLIRRMTIESSLMMKNHLDSQKLPQPQKRKNEASNAPSNRRNSTGCSEKESKIPKFSLNPREKKMTEISDSKTNGAKNSAVSNEKIVENLENSANIPKESVGPGESETDTSTDRSQHRLSKRRRQVNSKYSENEYMLKNTSREFTNAIRSRKSISKQSRPSLNRNLVKSDCVKSHEESSTLVASSELSKYTCKVCKNVFPKFTSLQRHMLIHSDTNLIHKCNNCDIQFKSENSLKYHNIVHHSGIKYDCETCGSDLKSKEMLRKHMLIHIAEDKGSKSKDFSENFEDLEESDDDDEMMDFGL